MTEIPEHLLKRSQAAREKAEGDDGSHLHLPRTNEERESAPWAVREDSDGVPPLPPNNNDEAELDAPEPREPLNLGKFFKPFLVVLGVFALPWLLLTIWMTTFWFTNFEISLDQKRWAARNFAPGNALFWWMLIVSGVVVLILTIYAYHTDHERQYWGQSRRGDLHAAIKNRTKHYEPTWKAITVSSVLLAVCFGGFLNAWWNNKDVPQYYNKATVFAVSDIKNPPDSVHYLTDGAKTGSGDGCLLHGDHDVPSCVIQASFPTQGFEERTMSYSGAMDFMSVASGTSSNSTLLTETGAYLESTTEEGTGYWSAIRDGHGINSHLEGVVTWDGTSDKTKLCGFDGKYRLNKALRGDRSNALDNLVREKYSPYFFNLVDVYGYCADHGNGDVEPILYIPLIKELRTGNRTVLAPAGLLEVHGSSSGEPRFVYHNSVTMADKIPGPVYPASIAAIQREEHTWAAGREDRDRNHFGFEPTSAKEQEGNPTDFFLKAKWDGREYWVSQMTPRGSNSEIITSYFLIPADQVTNGQLNTLTIYVLDKNDPRATNLEVFINRVKQAIASTRPGFFTSGGVLTEFTPIGDGKWIGYGLVGGLPSFKVRIDPTNFQPEFENDVVTTSGPGAVTGLDICQKPVSELSKDDLVTCIQGYAAAVGQK